MEPEICLVLCSAERSDDDQNFELELVLATIELGDAPLREARASGRLSDQPSQDLARRASDNADDDSHGSLQVSRPRCEQRVTIRVCA